MSGAPLPSCMGEPGTIIVYRLPSKYPAARRVRFVEKVWGQARRSAGRPTQRHGALEQIPHWKVSRGVVIVRASDGPKVVRELEAWDAEVEWWPISLEPRESTRLRARLS